MERSTLSVVIPTFNSQNTIRAALESVYAQSVMPDEVIVVDDESTDQTCAVVTANFPQVQLIRKQNGGPSSARNLGIKNSKYEWIAFLDADDIWAVDKNEIQLKEVEKNPRAAVVASSWTPNAHHLFDQARHRKSKVSTKTFWTSDILVLNRFQTSTVIARRSLLEELEGFRSELDGAEDWDMWLRLSRLGEVTLVEEPLVYYRDVTSGYSKDLTRLMTAMHMMMEREFSESSINPRLLKRIWAWHYLRFFVGFLLIKDFRGASGSLTSAIQSGLGPQLPSAAWNYLVPFLGTRVRRRFKK